MYLRDSEGQLFIRFTEDVGLKTNKGGLKHRKFEPKVLDVYRSANPDRCPIAIFEMYTSL